MECKDGVCVCKFQRQAVMKTDGSIECIRKSSSDLHVFLVKFAFFKTLLDDQTCNILAVPNTDYSPQRYIDPAMIGILVVMFLMFITICIVLRMFSK